jgi:hypothetical protein
LGHAAKGLSFIRKRFDIIKTNASISIQIFVKIKLSFEELMMTSEAGGLCRYGKEYMI